MKRANHTRKAALLLSVALLFAGCAAGTNPASAPASSAVTRPQSSLAEESSSQQEEGSSLPEGSEPDPEESTSASSQQSGPESTAPPSQPAGSAGSAPAGGSASAGSKAPAGGTPSSVPVSGPSAGKPATGATPSSSGGLHVSGTRLVDASGRPVQLRGISTHGIAWYPGYINEACFRQLHEEWNVNVIRLAMYTGEYGGYCTGGNKAQLKELIHKGVTYATAQNMYVIIDWHILSDGNPNQYLEQSKAFFAEMSARYANYNNVIYEICNEPNGGTSWGAIKAYAEKVIAVIRANDPDAVILVGTPNWSQYVDQAAADPITKYDNIMYTLHFYAATHTDALRNTMTAAIQNGLPIFVSEYGICDASGSGAINEAQANKWVSVMNQYGVSYVAWNLSNKAETSAILRSGCSKTSGFTESDLSASGKWLYRTLTGRSASAAAPASSAPAPAPTPTPAPASSTAPPPAPSSTPAPSVQAAFTAELQNRWESNGQSFYQYSVTIKNPTGSPCGQWSVDIPFSGNITLQDGWNGNYSINGSVLHITSKEYNGSLPAGGSTGNIGFIVMGGPELVITSS